VVTLTYTEYGVTYSVTANGDAGANISEVFEKFCQLLLAAGFHPNTVAQLESGDPDNDPT
jgi:hypothetical protein